MRGSSGRGRASWVVVTPCDGATFSVFEGAIIIICRRPGYPQYSNLAITCSFSGQRCLSSISSLPLRCDQPTMVTKGMGSWDGDMIVMAPSKTEKA